MTKPYPTIQQIQDATMDRLIADRAKMPQAYPLSTQSPQWGNLDGGLHEVQERMTSGSLRDAPSDGGPRPLGEQVSPPFKNMRNGR